MKVLIAGCGRVGALLATHLSLEGHDVAVIDHDRTAFGRLGAGFPGTTHRGKVFDRETLEEADIAHADAFCAVTSGDNSNVVAAKIAKEMYRVPRVVARIYEPRRAEIYRRLGIPAVSSVAWSANELLAILLHPHVTIDSTFGDGEVRIVSIEVPPRLDGRTTDDIAIPGEIMPIAVVRSGSSHLAVPGSRVHHGDILHVAVTPQSAARFAVMLTP